MSRQSVGSLVGIPSASCFLHLVPSTAFKQKSSLVGSCSNLNDTLQILYDMVVGSVVHEGPSALRRSRTGLPFPLVHSMLGALLCDGVLRAPMFW